MRRTRRTGLDVLTLLHATSEIGVLSGRPRFAQDAAVKRTKTADRSELFVEEDEEQAESSRRQTFSEHVYLHQTSSIATIAGVPQVELSRASSIKLSRTRAKERTLRQRAAHCCRECLVKNHSTCSMRIDACG